MTPKNALASADSPVPPASVILVHKDENEILHPTPKLFSWDGEEHKIYPMPDALLMTLSHEFNAVLSIVEPLIRLKIENALEIADVLPVLPRIVAILIPNATRIIAACLRVDEERVASGMTLGKKVEALRLIIEAEDLPLILNSFMALAATFRLPANAAPQATTDAPAAANQEG